MERFSYVYSNRLEPLFGRPSVRLLSPVVQDWLKKYRQTPLASEIAGALEDQLRKRTDISDIEKEKQLRASILDARAIDRVIYSNKVLETAYLDKKIDARIVLLYFSSAPKSSAIELMDAVRQSLPVIDGKPFNVFRTPAQIFTSFVHRNQTLIGTYQLDEAISSLKQTKNNIEHLDELKRRFETGLMKCDSDCSIFGGGDDSCEWNDWCKKIERLTATIMDKRRECNNLRLVDAFSAYGELLERKPVGRRYEEYISFIKFIASSPNVKGPVRARMRHMRKVVAIKCAFTRRITEVFVRGKEVDDSISLRSSKDHVTGVDQYLPIVPRFKDKEYQEIVALLVEYFRAPRKVMVVEEAIKKFVEMEITKKSESVEHELARCFIYLSLPQGEGDTDAYDLALELFRSEEAARDADVKREIAYVLAWEGRRLGRYEETDAFIERALREWPEDARFYHGRFLNGYAWMRKGELGRECPYSVSELIDIMGETLRRFQMNEEECRDLIISGYNNMAFLYAFPTESGTMVARDGRSYLDHARLEIEKLKSLYSKASWDPGHPEFYHTEAFIAFREFEEGLRIGAGREYLEKVLREAWEDVEMAVKLFPNGPGYRALEASVERGMKMMKMTP